METNTTNTELLARLIDGGATFTTRGDTHPVGAVHCQDGLLVWAVQGAENEHHFHAERGIELRKVAQGLIEVVRGDALVGTFKVMDGEERARYFWPAWKIFLSTEGSARWKRMFAAAVRLHAPAGPDAAEPDGPE